VSHVVEIEPDTAEQAIQSLHVAELAAKRLGGELIRNKKTYKWYGRHVGDYKLPEGQKPEDLGKCEHVIRFPGVKYEVGLVASKKHPGTYKLGYDFYDRGLKKIMGENGGPFMQLYQVEVAKIQAQKIDGNCTESEVDEEGNIYIDIDTTARIGH